MAATDPTAYSNPCHTTEHGKNSDLCQQWRMAKAAEEQRDFTKYLFGVTVIEIIALIAVLGFTVCATKAAVDANKISKREFNASHRPKLRVRSVSAHIHFIVNGEPPNAEVTVANVGDTEAHVSHFGGDFARMKDGKWEPPGFKSAAQPLPQKIRIGPGKRCTFTITKDTPFDANEYGLIHRQVMTVFCIGEIIYEDSLASVRYTGFMREWDDSRERFIRTENKFAEEYEFED